MCLLPLCSCVQHIFYKSAIAGGRIVNEDMGDGADQLAVLNNGAAGHFCVK